MNRRLIAAAGLILGVVTAGPALAAAPAQPPAETSRYIVVLKSGTSLSNVYSGQTHHVFSHALNGFSATMSAGEASRLSANPNVAYVQESRMVRQTGEQTNPPSWGIDRSDQVNLPLDKKYVYPGEGAGVHVYIMDSGIRLTHTDLAGRTIDGKDFTSETDGTSNECSTNGHGTHVAGTIAGTAYGIAKRATVVALQTVGCGGSGPDDDLVEAIDWVTANAQKPAVVNISLTADVADHPAMNQAIRNSVASGVVYAIAAGNHGDNACNHSPSRVTEALIVGGSDNDDTIRDGTNTGNCIDIFAPGGNIVSLNSNSDTGTSTRSGTSMASPHIAGAAAMVLAANPSFTPAQVEQRLIEKSTKDKLTQIGASPNRLLNVTGLTSGDPGDTTPPSTPGNLRSTGKTTTSVSLAWDASTDNVGVTGYDVYVGGNLSANVATTSATVSGLTSGTAYSFTVKAKDAAGNASAASDSVTVTTDTGPPVPNGVVNGGFESSLDGWTKSGNATSVSSPVQAGAKAARLGPAGTSSLSQTFTAAGTQLLLWYKLDCTGWGFGSLTITLRDGSATTTLVNKFCGSTAYTQATATLVKGRSYTLTITQTDSSFSGATASSLVDSVVG